MFKRMGMVVLVALAASCSAQSSYVRDSRSISLISHDSTRDGVNIAPDELGIIYDTRVDGVTPVTAKFMQVVDDTDHSKYLYGLAVAEGVDEGVFLTGFQAINSAEAAKEKCVTEQSPSGGNRKRFVVPQAHYDPLTRTAIYVVPGNLVTSFDLGLVQFVKPKDRPTWHYVVGVRLLWGPGENWAQFGTVLPSNWENCDAYANHPEDGPAIMALGMYPAGELRTWHVKSGHVRGDATMLATPNAKEVILLSDLKVMLGILPAKEVAAK